MGAGPRLDRVQATLLTRCSAKMLWAGTPTRCSLTGHSALSGCFGQPVTYRPLRPGAGWSFQRHAGRSTWQHAGRIFSLEPIITRSVGVFRVKLSEFPPCSLRKVLIRLVGPVFLFREA